MEEDEDVFLDAIEDLDLKSATNGYSQQIIEKVGCVSLTQGLHEGQLAIDRFLNNDYEGARDLTEKYADESIYHALGYGTFYYLKAVMTFEQEHVEAASVVLSRAVATIDRFRRKQGIGDSLGKIMKKRDYNDMTETEVHAELVFAECLLLKAMLTIVEDENLVSFVKAGMKVRQCYVSFKECTAILHKRDWSNDEHKSHFEGGVRLGVGLFHLIMSLLPARITKLMEFVGFSGSKEVGMSELLSCYRNPVCLRQFLSSIILLGYHLFLVTNMGNPDDCDRRLVEEILTEKLTKYPESAFFLFFKGRYELISGRCESASVWYTRANNSQMTWPQFQHVGCWELVWSACLRGLWRDALCPADRLLRESRWSPCMYSYFKAALYCELSEELTEEERKEMNQLMETLPTLKQRIGGKSIPIEKFVIKKAEKFKSQNGWLLLPGLELLYLSHGFSIIGQQHQMVERFHLMLLEAENKYKNLSVEDECLLAILRGMCLKHLGCPLQAEEAFCKVLSMAPQITVDKYLVPYATVELAFILLQQGNIKQGSDLLNTARNFTNYALQSRLHLRIHAMQNKLKAQLAKEGETKSVPESTPDNPTRLSKQAPASLPALPPTKEHSSLPNSTSLPNSFQDGVKPSPAPSLKNAMSDFKDRDVNPLI